MVGWFVKHHGFGLLVEHAHKVHASALSSRQRREVFEEILLVETQAGGEAGHFRFSFVATEVAEALFNVGEGLDVFTRGISGHSVAGRVHVGVELVEAAGRKDVGQTNGFNTESTGHWFLGQVGP